MASFYLVAMGVSFFGVCFFVWRLYILTTAPPPLMPKQSLAARLAREAPDSSTGLNSAISVDDVEAVYIRQFDRIAFDNTVLQHKSFVALALAALFTFLPLLLLDFMVIQASEVIKGAKPGEITGVLLGQIPRITLGIGIQAIGIIFIRHFTQMNELIRVNNKLLIERDAALSAYHVMNGSWNNELKQLYAKEMLTLRLPNSNDRPGDAGASTLTSATDAAIKRMQDATDWITKKTQDATTDHRPPPARTT
jgi:hypothetical protein